MMGCKVTRTYPELHVTTATSSRPITLNLAMSTITTADTVRRSLYMYPGTIFWHQRALLFTYFWLQQSQWRFH